MADSPIELTIVTPERALVHEHVDELEIPGAAGYFGVLPGHAALFSELMVGEFGYRKGARWYFLSMAWGFVEIQSNQVRVLAETAERPVYARAASDNVGSLRVLEKAGFRRVGVNRGFAPGRGEEIEETILRLD